MSDKEAGGARVMWVLAVLAALAVGAWLWLRLGPDQTADVTEATAPITSAAGWVLDAPEHPEAVPVQLQMAIDKAGGAKLLQPMASATWQRAYDWPGGEATGELLHQAGVGTLRRGVEPGVEVGRVGERCWLRRGKVVTDCALEDRALLRIHQAAHDATVLVNLGRAPYQPVGVAAASLRRHGARALFFDLADGPWRVIVIFDVAGGFHAETVTLLHRQRRLAPIHMDLHDRAPMAGIQVATTRRLHFEERMVRNEDGSQVPSVEVERMTALEAGVNADALRPPQPTTEAKLTLGSRPAMLVALADVPEGHEGALAALDRAEGLLPPELPLVEPEWFEVIGTGAEPDGVPRRVQVWVASALYTVGAERTDIGRKLTRIEAEPRIARRIVRATFGELPGRLRAFADEATAAGHLIARRPRVVRVLRIPGSTGDAPAGQPWLVELQLPLMSSPTAAD